LKRKRRNKVAFSSNTSVQRKKLGFLSTVNKDNHIGSVALHSVNSQSPTLDSKKKLPSLQKRLKRLVDPIAAKSKVEKLMRKVSIKSRKKEQNHVADPMKSKKRERNKIIDRLAMLGNISIAPVKNKNTTIQDIWRGHDSVVERTKRSDFANPINHASYAQSPEISLIEKESPHTIEKTSKTRRKKPSFSTHAKNLDLFLEDSIIEKYTKTSRKKKSKKGRKRGLNKSVIQENVGILPKSLEHHLSKKIKQVNPSFDEAFKYYDNDIHDLIEDKV